jgi:hypothetical protein
MFRKKYISPFSPEHPDNQPQSRFQAFMDRHLMCILLYWLPWGTLGALFCLAYSQGWLQP